MLGIPDLFSSLHEGLLSRLDQQTTRSLIQAARNVLRVCVPYHNLPVVTSCGQMIRSSERATQNVLTVFL